ncbi:hypothetical protein [Clostridium folliculivorans]|nr:hypothetical protein [Clostridium folliculivorans]
MKSLVLKIIAIVTLELVLSLMRILDLNILNDSLLGNVLLEATIEQSFICYSLLT